MSNAKKIRVIVVDDSLFMRQMISDILNADPDIEVIAVANDGLDGLAKVKDLKPDVVTLDYKMPGLDGLATLKKIILHCPVPVIMISAYTPAGGETTLEALAQGAVDYVCKPTAAAFDLSVIQDEILNRIKVAAMVKTDQLVAVVKAKAQLLQLPDTPLVKNRAVVIGSSTGGTKVVELILESLPLGFPAPLVIVQHMPPVFTKLFADRLNKQVKIMVKEGENGEAIKPGVAYIAPGGKHMLVELDKDKQPVIVVSQAAPINEYRPSVDLLMESVARVYGSNTIGLLLSGMGADGATAMGTIVTTGGVTLAQDERTSILFGMAKRAYEMGNVDELLPAGAIANRLVELVS
jgi:two-component system, chemotaxis family, protein-glutamate methylesterase/glutaminase